MKPALTKIFVTLGVVFLFLLLVGGYFYVTDEVDFKPMIFGTKAVEVQNDNSSPATGGFQLSAAQKQALIAVGIDPGKVPSSIDANQEACFEAALGEARVGEIKAGAVPSATEFLKAKSCI